MQFIRLDQGPKTLSGPWLPQEKGCLRPCVFPHTAPWYQLAPQFLALAICCSPASQKGPFLDTLGATHLHPE